MDSERMLCQIRDLIDKIDKTTNEGEYHQLSMELRDKFREFDFKLTNGGAIPDSWCGG